MVHSDTVLNGLTRIFHQVRGYLLGEGRTHLQELERNGKGEVSLAMDRQAEEVAVQGFRKLFGSFRLFAEERGVVTEGSPAEGAQLSLVLDPCDGSANFARGIRATGFSVAVLEGAELDLGRVRYGLIGDVSTGHVYAAARGQGATRNGQPIRGSQLTDLAKAFIGLSVSGTGLPRLASVEGLRPIKTVRSMGAATLDLAYVADGGYDACLFLWKNLTPENFAAASLIIAEAGGRLTDHRGLPFGLCELTTPYTVVAAGNPALHELLVQALRDTEPVESPAPAQDGHDRVSESLEQEPATPGR